MRCRVGFVVALILAALCWWMGIFEGEPSYQGQSATDWLNSGDSREAIAAFRAMGPKGARFLARTLETRPFQLPDKVETLMGKLNLPAWADPTHGIQERAARLEHLQETAWDVLHDLGRDAEPALPILVRIFRQHDGRVNSAGLLAPMADKLQFMVPELVRNLNQKQTSDYQALANVQLLSAIGPAAKEATPVLLRISQSEDEVTAQLAVVALWNIDRKTNELIRYFSTNLRRHDASALFVLSRLEAAGPVPKPLAPLLAQTLRHPDPSVRGAAEYLLDTIDPDRLRQIAEELNSHQDALLRDHLKLLQSTNNVDRFNAARALQFFGPRAAAAVPRLVEILLVPRIFADRFNDRSAAFAALKSLGSNASAATPALVGLLRSNQIDAPEICDVLAAIGPQAAEAVPALQALLETNYVTDTSGYRYRNGRGFSSTYHREIVPRWKVAQALASIDPHNSHAIAVLREARGVKEIHSSRFGCPTGTETSLPATLTLWKLGLETNLPLDEFVTAGDFDTLGDIGPAAKKAVPMIEKALVERQLPFFNAALALCRIDPEAAKRLGLPGLFIICPAKY